MIQGLALHLMMIVALDELNFAAICLFNQYFPLYYFFKYITVQGPMSYCEPGYTECAVFSQLH